jgi:hypothetical protein
VGSACITCRKYVDYSLKMFQGGKKQIKRSGEREIVYNVYRFVKTECVVGVRSLFQKFERDVLAGELYVGY